MRLFRTSLAAVLVALASAASAQEPDKGALDEGRQLLAEHKCNGSCHQSYSADNEALSLYTRADRKAVDRAGLDRYVRLCVSNVGSMVFPEDVSKMAAALNFDFYKYK